MNKEKQQVEFVSKGGDPSAGTQTLRVNEPGRTAQRDRKSVV